MTNQNSITNGLRNSRSVGLLIWALVLVMIALNSRLLIPAAEQASKGAADFSIFHVGANMLRTGWSRQLYNLNSQARFQSAYYQSHPLPYNHPSYELLVFLPLASLSLSSAYYAWMCVNVAILLIIASI